MARKPSLADLATRKPTVAQEMPPAAAESRAGAARAGAQADGRKGILIRVQPEGWRQLRDLAADLTLSSGEQVTMQSLLVDALNDLLRKNGRPPVA